jgi:hypothetical protein
VPDMRKLRPPGLADDRAALNARPGDCGAVGAVPGLYRRLG